jgi:hypothetical protein
MTKIAKEIKIRVGKSFSIIVNILILTLFTLVVGSAAETQPDPVLDLEALSSGSFNGCMVERYNLTKPASVDSLNCTSNDVQLAQYTLVSGPTSCMEGEEITVVLLGEFLATSDERYDVGVFVSLDGGTPNALGGSCYNDFLHPVSTDNTDLNLIDGFGPYYNAEITEDPVDACGDIQQAENAFFQTAEITITCQDSDNNNIADVSSCTVWANSKSDGSGKPSCTSEFDTTAETSAKCTCANVEIGGLEVPYDGTIEVIKDLEPDVDPGLFDLQIDGVTQFTDASDGDSTGPKIVDAGISTDPDPIGVNHTVGEIAGTGTDLAKYDSKIYCTDGVDTVGPFAGAGPVEVFVQPDDNWVCTISNTRRTGEVTACKADTSGNPLEGWTIQVFDASGALIDSDLTDLPEGCVTFTLDADVT